MPVRQSPSYHDARQAERQNTTCWTVRALLAWTTDYFCRAGLSSPRLDAEVLLAHALHQDRLSLYRHYEDEIHEPFLTVYREMIQRRKKFEPVSYITGTREFFSISFSVDPSVLIPRPETEHIVEYALQHVREYYSSGPPDPLRILDIGTGSGNLPVALALHIPQAWILALDISGPTLVSARKNVVQQDNLAERILFLQGDLVECLHRQRARFQLIVSNPPYVPVEEMDGLPAEIRDYEPHIALNGGAGGTLLQERIFREAGLFLTPGGVMIMEIGEHQDKPLLALVREIDIYEQCHVFQDYAGKPRILVAQRA